MSAPEILPVTIHQCLYGYDDGHRLLASSVSLVEEAASQLLPLSDLAPGGLSGEQRYWTGAPVLSMKSYGLMCTWLAPEMPRPGCVWTQILLISFSDMARFFDLAELIQSFGRPDRELGWDTYRTPLRLQPSLNLEPREGANFGPADALRLLRALYQPNAPKILEGDDATARALFALWSQQWPRLRRGFSFRTAGARSHAAPDSRFDIQLTPRERTPTPILVSDPGLPPEIWEQAPLADLVGGGWTPFRKFIWRYGSDVNRGRSRFNFLSRLFAETRVDRLATGELTRILQAVAHEFPDRSEAKLLKEDLMSAGRSRFALVPSGDVIDMLEFYVRDPKAAALPEPPPEAFDAVDAVWSQRPTHILDLTERAIEKGAPMADALLERVISLSGPSTFLALSQAFPHTRAKTLAVRPDLLDSEDVLTLPRVELLELLEHISSDDVLTDRVLARLLVVEDEIVAKRCLELLPHETIAAILRAMSVRNAKTSVAPIWVAAVRETPSADRVAVMLKTASSTTSLAACAALLEYDVGSGLMASSADWAEALARGPDDVDGELRQRLLTYLLSIGLARPTRGCEELFEKSFETVHADLSASRLPWDAFGGLAPYLQDLAWWQQWDTCLRLRSAIVSAYVERGLDPASFRRLASDVELMDRLIGLAERSKRGRRFLKKVAA